jgi:molecular chaperone GrpE
VEDQDVPATETGSGTPVGADADAPDGPDRSATDLDDSGEPARVQELRAALDELNDRYLRLAAEFDNYRKRSRTELAESRSHAQAGLVGTLLDALDDFARVTSVGPEDATVHALHEGVTLVERKLRAALATAGLEEINPVDQPFDPNEMEAMVRIAAESEEEDERVAEVYQPGFRFAGHLVRPARVSVRKLD